MTRHAAALAAAICVLIVAPAAASADVLPVQARVTIGFTNESTTDVEATGLVTGKPFRRGAMETRSRFDGRTASGRFTLFDGRGSLRGRSVLTTTDGSSFTGTFTSDGGSGRYARATGKLRFSGALDDDAIPAVTVLPGSLRGRLRVRPVDPRPRRDRPLAVDFRGKGAKVHFRQLSVDPFLAKLTTAQATAMNRFGNGVLLEVADIDLRTQLRPSVITWYGADGTWTAKGTPSLATGPSASDPLRVTGGTGRYRGARGRLAYTLLTDPGFSGLKIVRLRGGLRFPG